MNKIDSYKRGVKLGLPIAFGYFAVSFSFGMMAVSGGLTVLDSVLISLTNLTSAGQFAGLGIILANGTYFEMFLTQLVINLRYTLMSFSLSQKLDRRESFINRFFAAFGVTDEIFAITVAEDGKASHYFMYGAMSVSIPSWTLGTLFGALLGNVLPTFIVSALSIAIYGMFIAIIIPPAKKDRNILYVIIASMLISTCFEYLPVLNDVSSGFVIIVTTIVVSLVASKFAPIKDSEGTHE